MPQQIYWVRTLVGTTRFYGKHAVRFFDLSKGLGERDLACYLLLDGVSGEVLRYSYSCGSRSMIVCLARKSRVSKAVDAEISEMALDGIGASLPKILDGGELTLLCASK